MLRLENVIDTDNVSGVLKHLNEGTSVNFEIGGVPILSHAIEAHAKNVAELLILRGADVNRPTPSQQIFPLEYAFSKDNLDLVKLLLKHGAKLLLKDYYGRIIFEKLKKNYRYWENPTLRNLINSYHRKELGQLTEEDKKEIAKIEQEVDQDGKKQQ